MSSLPLRLIGPQRGFSADRRFAALAACAAGKPAAPQPNPVDEAFARGREEGYAEALALAEARAAEADAARERIELAFARLDEQSAADLRERLRVTVLALCEEAVAPLAVNARGLAKRIERAVAMLQRKQDECVVRLHPRDLALVQKRLPEGFPLQADPSLERGALLIETADGGIEDGPSQWRAILAEAFGAC
jgi:flagellar assembly protein FliH